MKAPTTATGSSIGHDDPAITAHRFEDARDSLYRTWLPGSGYEPDDRPCIPGAFRCDLRVPVRLI